MSGRSVPRAVTAGPGLSGPGLPAGQFLAEDGGDEIPAVPSGAPATRARPLGPGGQDPVETAGAFAGTALAERRQPYRYHPHEKRDGDGDDRGGTGIVRTCGAGEEYCCYYENPPHASDGH